MKTNVVVLGAGFAGLELSTILSSEAPDEIDVMAAVKHALDPHGILNPGVLLPERGDERGLVSIGGGMTWQGP